MKSIWAIVTLTLGIGYYKEFELGVRFAYRKDSKSLLLLIHLLFIHLWFNIPTAKIDRKIYDVRFFRVEK